MRSAQHPNGLSLSGQSNWYVVPGIYQAPTGDVECRSTMCLKHSTTRQQYWVIPSILYCTRYEYEDVLTLSIAHFPDPACRRQRGALNKNASRRQEESNNREIVRTAAPVRKPAVVRVCLCSPFFLPVDIQRNQCPCRFFKVYHVCVLHINRSFYPSTSSTTSVRGMVSSINMYR